MSKNVNQSDVRELFAEARRIAGGRPGGALRLMLMRLRRNRAEDLAVRSTVGRVLTIEGFDAPEPASLPLPQLLRHRGYRPLGDSGRIWLYADAGRSGDAVT